MISSIRTRTALADREARLYYVCATVECGLRRGIGSWKQSFKLTNAVSGGQQPHNMACIILTRRSKR